MAGIRECVQCDALRRGGRDLPAHFDRHEQIRFAMDQQDGHFRVPYGFHRVGGIRIEPAEQAGTSALRPAFEALGYRFKFVYNIVGKEYPLQKITSYLNACGKFDLIFVDPPYDAELYKPVLDKINSIDILSEGGIILCESRRETIMPEMKSPYYLRKEYRYGKVKLSLYSKESRA